MTHQFWRRAVAASFAFALAASACGGDSSDEDAATSTTNGETGTTDAGSTETTAAGADDEIGTITDDNIAIGTGGYTIDLNDCPDGWSNTGGITDDEIKLAHSWIFSGTLAAYGALHDGMEAYFNWAAEENADAFGGRKITLEAKDDGYEPARVVANTQEIVQSIDPFAIPGMAGTPGNLATYDYLNEQCIPHIFPGTGHPAFGDPVNHPWSTMNYLAYTTEGSIWAQYILDLVESGDLPKPAKVAFLQTNNDFGKAWDIGFKAIADEHPDEIDVVAQELFESSAPNITNEITTLMAAEPDVFIGGVVGTSCTQDLTEIAQSSFDPQVKIQGSVCAQLSFWTPAGDAGDGWLTVTDRKDIADASNDDDPFIVEMRAMFDDAGVDWRGNANAGLALQYSPPVIESMLKAAELPGGLTRTNLMIAAYSLDFEHPYGWPGNRWTINGLEDAYPSEQAQFLRYVAAGDTGSFETVGDLIDLSGTTPLCPWNGTSCG